MEQVTQEMFDEKVYQEYKEFKNEALQCAQDELFDFAFEINFKTELMRYLSDPENTPEEVRGMLYRLENILDKGFLLFMNQYYFTFDFDEYGEDFIETLTES